MSKDITNLIIGYIEENDLQKLYLSIKDKGVSPQDLFLSNIRNSIMRGESLLRIHLSNEKYTTVCSDTENILGSKHRKYTFQMTTGFTHCFLLVLCADTRKMVDKARELNMIVKSPKAGFIDIKWHNWGKE